MRDDRNYDRATVRSMSDVEFRRFRAESMRHWAESTAVTPASGPRSGRGSTGDCGAIL